METDKRLFWIWLSLLGRPNHFVTALILETFGTPEEAWRAADRKQIPEILQKKEKLFCRLCDSSLRMKACRILNECDKREIRIAAVEDPEYPFYLRQVTNRPTVLYYKGRLPNAAGVAERLLLSVVGSRKCTPYGRTNAFLFSKHLAEQGIGIVSGMARGIDAEAHKGALAGAGYTIAVLGGGADVVYPGEHQKLYAEICEKGCVLSEYPPGTPPLKSHFPARNRIISGLSLGTLVAEASRRSGAMITVDRAYEQNRTVYAIPGNIGSEQSEGCNELLKTQGVCVTSYLDILEDYGLKQPAPLSEKCGWIGGLTEAEAAVAAALKRGSYHIDEIVRDADRSTASILSALTMLEIKGIVTKGQDGTYRLIK